MLTIKITAYEPLIDNTLDPIITEQYEEIIVDGETGWRPLQDDEYYITQKANGADLLTFSLSIFDPTYAYIEELNEVRDSDGTRYLVQKIDAGNETAKVICALNLDEWKAALYPAYNSGSNSIYTIINAVKPSGWTVQDYSGLAIRRTIEGDLTPYDIVQECLNTFSAYARFDNVNKVIQIYNTTAPQPIGAFASRQLNLKELNYKGDAQNVITRLYPYGADGLGIAKVNGGVNYVENYSYYGATVSAVWRDDRYTDAESLKQDAIATLEHLAIPDKSYQCKVIDLAKIDAKYSNQDFSLFNSIMLVDDIRGTTVAYQIVEKTLYPHYPENNGVTLSTVPAKIQGQVQRIIRAIDNPNSTFRQIMTAQAKNATNWLTSADGYVVMVEEDGACKEILFLDTPDIATAQNVLRINTNGIGFSKNGVNGPYTNAWTIDGNLLADFITAGTMSADRINGGTLSLGGKDNGNGVLLMYNARGNEIGRWDNTGVSITQGNIDLGDGALSLTNYGRLTASAENHWISMFRGYIRGGIDDTDYMHLDAAVTHLSTGKMSTDLGSLNGNDLTLLTDSEDARILLKIGSGNFYSAVGSLWRNDARTDAISYIYQSNSGGTYYIGFAPFSGTVRFATVTTSDQKLKENIEPSEVNALDTIGKIRHVAFDFIESGAHRDCGYIAQDLQKLIPEAVIAAPEVGPDGEFSEEETLQIVDHEILTYCTKAIQELKAKVEALEAQIGARNG